MLSPTAEVLERKKRELESEVVAFKNRKEDEYRAFERQYMREACGSVGQSKDIVGASKQEQGDLFLGQHGVLHPQQGRGIAEAEDKAHQHIENSRTFRRSHTGTQDTALRAGFEGSEGQKERQKGSVSKAQLHERELEFQGLFTPSFLPLLDSKGNEIHASAGVDSSNGESPTPQSSSNSRALPSNNGATDANPEFSSSASILDTNYTSSLSPPHIRFLSASVPRESTHQRRSSSKSNLSIASLRSSIRDPKQPRSPKRVLFSLGDKLVSPSTSPLIQRANGESRTPIPNSNTALSQTTPGNSRNSNSAWDIFPWSKQASDVTSVHGTPLPISDTTTPFEQPGRATDRSPLTGGDDFESIDADEELFAFDEDVAGRKLNFKGENNSSIHVESDEDEDEDSSEMILGSSPHAGSLPIEIKWPTRFMSSS